MGHVAAGRGELPEIAKHRPSAAPCLPCSSVPRFRCGAATEAGPSSAVAARGLRVVTDHVAHDAAAILLVRGPVRLSRRAPR